MAAKKLTLEQSFEGLDAIIEELQTGELTLEQSFKKACGYRRIGGKNGERTF